ncbi:MAG: MBL fold metallo-hydrolase [Methanomassiliicoccales archaeon]|nr:MBL fold metallo-hydrolase [Methanomassiliicoccales archaeon]
MNGPRALIVLAVIAIIIVVVAAGVALPMLLRNEGETDHVGEMRVFFLDVDQGDAILIQTPDGKNIMVDCGYVDYASEVIEFLRGHDVQVIDAFIATHPDPDHIGSVPTLFDEFRVLSVYHSGFVKTTQTYENFIAAIEAEDCPIYDDNDIDAGDLLPLSSNVTFEVLSIDSTAEDSNDASIVLKVTHGDVDLILEGDASWSTELDMVERFGEELDVEVLKVSHHGSSSASSYDWLDATSPETAIVCIGPNDWGLPAQSIMDRLETYAGEVYTTDGEGGILVLSNGLSCTATGLA